MILMGLIIWVISHIMLYRIYYIGKFRQGMVSVDWEGYNKLPSFTSMVFDFRRWRWQIKFVPIPEYGYMGIGEVPAASPTGIVGEVISATIIDENPQSLIMTGRIIKAVAGVNEHVGLGDIVRIQMSSSRREAIGRVTGECGRAAGLEFFEISIVDSADAVPFLGIVDEPASPKAIAWEERWYKRK